LVAGNSTTCAGMFSGVVDGGQSAGGVGIVAAV
jgi:hypothetical protein